TSGIELLLRRYGSARLGFSAAVVDWQSYARTSLAIYLFSFSNVSLISNYHLFFIVTKTPRIILPCCLLLQVVATAVRFFDLESFGMTGERRVRSVPAIDAHSGDWLMGAIVMGILLLLDCVLGPALMASVAKQ